MPQYQIKRLNHRHNQIINWLVANPHQNLSACAAAFGYSLSWLSQLVHSDAFQAHYHQRCDEVGAATVHTVKDKLTGLAVLAMDKMAERIQSGIASEKAIGEVMSSTLKSLGYGGDAPKANGDTPREGDKHLHVHVTADSLRDARAIAAQAFNGTTDKKLDNHGNARGLPALPAA